ncbi:nicotinate-nucleotide--dimethylbenzimidazole phosphoribosyltransferase [Thalassotalea ganghwensis]
MSILDVTPLDNKFSEQIKAIINNKTKPLGALGQLESLAWQLAMIQSQSSTQATTKIAVCQSAMLVFAGDHGIAKHGISIAPSEVTEQMVMNFMAGGAAVNCFCRIADIDLHVVDCGILSEPREILPSHAYLHRQRLGAGTEDFSSQSAMSAEQVDLGLNYGEKIVKDIAEQGCQIMLLGEMGIGNTSSASALLALLTNTPVIDCVGKGTGINDEQYQRKVSLIEQAKARIDSTYSFNGEALNAELLRLLAEVGGFEIVQMIGAIIAAAKQQLPVVIDGFIVSVAALYATKLSPAVKDYLIFAHCSQEKAHKLVLAHLDAKPLLDLGLRLGEGSGAALAMPMIKAAAAFYNDMASFDSAGVTV